jgi:hypothetical protein
MRWAGFSIYLLVSFPLAVFIHGFFDFVVIRHERAQVKAAAEWVANRVAGRAVGDSPRLAPGVLRHLFPPLESLDIASLDARGRGKRAYTDQDLFFRELLRHNGDVKQDPLRLMEVFSSLAGIRSADLEAAPVYMPIVDAKDAPRLKAIAQELCDHSEGPVRLFIVAAGEKAMGELAGLESLADRGVYVMRGGSAGVVDAALIQQKFGEWSRAQGDIRVIASLSPGISLTGVDALNENSILGRALRILLAAPIQPADLEPYLNAVAVVLRQA